MRRKSILDTRPEVRKKAIQEEREIARRLSGKVQKASGAMPAPSRKGDVTTQEFVIESKLTESNTLSIPKSVLTKIQAEAFSVGKEPALVVNVGGSRWVCIRMDLFESTFIGEE